MKTYDKSIIQHIIRLKEGVNPIRDKLTQVNPSLLPIIENEVKKLLEDHIIVPLR